MYFLVNAKRKKAIEKFNGYTGIHVPAKYANMGDDLFGFISVDEEGKIKDVMATGKKEFSSNRGYFYSLEPELVIEQLDADYIVAHVNDQDKNGYFLLDLDFALKSAGKKKEAEPIQESFEFEAPEEPKPEETVVEESSETATVLLITKPIKDLVNPDGSVAGLPLPDSYQEKVEKADIIIQLSKSGRVNRSHAIIRVTKVESDLLVVREEETYKITKQNYAKIKTAFEAGNDTVEIDQ